MKISQLEIFLLIVNSWDAFWDDCQLRRYRVIDGRDLNEQIELQIFTLKLKFYYYKERVHSLLSLWWVDLLNFYFEFNMIIDWLLIEWERLCVYVHVESWNLIDDDFWLFSLIWKITCTEGCSWIMFDGRKLAELVIEMWMKNVVEIFERWSVVMKIYWLRENLTYFWIFCGIFVIERVRNNF